MKVLTVLGARPQFIKAAPVSRALAGARGTREVILHTGQHFDDNMSNLFFQELGIPEPAYNLAIREDRHGAMTGRMLAGIESVLVAEASDWVLVYGDTNSTLAGALAAAKLHVPVAHVEAGLRSHNRRMPEEINRVVTDHVSTLLFCPTRTAVANLAAEGIREGVCSVGDVMYDATLHARDQARRSSELFERYGLRAGEFALATVHRAENTDDRTALARVIEYLNDAAETEAVVLPVHPRTRQAAESHGLAFGALTLLPPAGFLDMAALLDACTRVFTDSGGLQKEAYFHGKPCVTLRSETEWTETVECGWNRLWNEPHYKPRRPIYDYGDGRAAVRIVDKLRSAGGRPMLGSALDRRS